MHPPTQIAAFDDVQLAFRVYNPTGSGTPLLMIQGWTGVKEDWDEMPVDLAQDRPVLIYDNRGMGESTIPDGPYTMEQLAGDAVRMLDLMGWQRAHVMGISMGGMIAQTVALSVPERVDHLILGCTTHGGLGQVSPEPEVLMALQAPAQGDMREVVRNFLWINFTDEWIRDNPEGFEKRIDKSMQARRPRRGMFHQMAAVMEFDAEELCGTITAPTLILHGERDRLIPYGNAKSLASKISGSVLHPLSTAGHAFWQMDEGESGKVIREFLQPNS